MSTILKVSNLSKNFTGSKKGFFGKADLIHAVNNVSFEIKSGQALGLVGESGCGKSTTGRLITRLLQPTSGKIEFDGVDITKLSNSDLSNSPLALTLSKNPGANSCSITLMPTAVISGLPL